MNAMQFQTALLEAQQRARIALEAHMQAMTPPQAPQQQGVQNAPNIPTQLPSEEIGQRPDIAGAGNVPAG